LEIKINSDSFNFQNNISSGIWISFSLYHYKLPKLLNLDVFVCLYNPIFLNKTQMSS
jgi:hypothetical protein